jgi:hypothetical protein
MLAYPLADTVVIYCISPHTVSYLNGRYRRFFFGGWTYYRELVRLVTKQVIIK